MNTNITHTVEITMKGDVDAMNTCVALLDQNHIQYHARCEWKAQDIVNGKIHNWRYYTYSFAITDVEKAINVMNPSGVRLYVTLLTPEMEGIKVRCNEYHDIENLIDYIVETDADTENLALELM